MDLYREEILEHWQNPQNFGKLDDADLVIEQVNPLCGDQIRFYFKIAMTHPRGEVKESSGRHLGGVIQNVSFVGNGCAISIASASILSENIKGKSLKSLSKITGDKVLELIGGPVTPARLRCVFLALEAIRKLT